jgi:hypothetical protein
VSTQAPEPDDPALVRYLIGQASEEETERLDEQSVVDERFAVRLRAVEHDLVDAYVGGELVGETLEAFKAQYLSSPSGLAAVDFARALRAQPAAAPRRVVTPAVAAWHGPRWLAAAAALLVAATAWLLIDNLRLRSRLADARSEQAVVAERARQLEDTLQRQQSAASTTAQELARAREALAAAVARTGTDRPVDRGNGLLALALTPAMRGGGTVPSLQIPHGTKSVVLRLQLTALDFAHYEVALHKAGAERASWRSGRVARPSAADKNALPVTVRTSLLQPGAYTLELTGIPARGEAEPLDSYPFRVVR